ncbi:DUF1844 domain-containing protein [bacterium]|nr:DUF1844 domain-containing protein [bacterium]
MPDDPNESTTEEAAEAKRHSIADANSPEARFTILVSSIATQALVGLGEFEHPITKEKQVDLGSAQYSIDLLQTLVDKTKGNLNDDEDRYLSGILYDLRMRFVDAGTKSEEKPS